MLIFKFIPAYMLKIGLFPILLLLFLIQNTVGAQLELRALDYLSDDDYRAERFLKGIAEEISRAAAPSFADQKPAFITVNHIVPTVLPYLSALSSVGDVAMIIPKGNNPNPQVHSYLTDTYGDNYRMSLDPSGIYNVTMTRPMLDSARKVFGILVNVKRQYRGQPIIIIDIGGYFSNALKIPQAALVRFKVNLVGIVEDTENGHQKYEKAIREGRHNEVPLYSVARSELKKTEDYCVGKSIVEATDTLFRIKKHTILERMQTVGVMGYGKIGSSIAEHLRRKNIHVFVSEVIPLRAQLALSNDHNVVFDSDHPELGYKKLFPRTKVIFGATGQKALKIEDLKEWLTYQDVIYLSSCTSAVDEYDFNPSRLSDDDYFQLHRKDEQVLEFTAEDERKKVVFFREGNAVNFCFGGVNGPYIYSVQSALLTAASKLFSHRRFQDTRRRPQEQALMAVARVLPTFHGEIMELDRSDEMNISKTFLRFFVN
jgi:adenosylhomocysteinase